MMIWLIIMLFCSPVMAQEVVTKLDESGKNIINEELRRTRASGVNNAASIVALQASITDKFNTSTGHDHDGTDSKKVLVTNLDATGITVDHYLYNDAGVIRGKALPDTSFKLISTTSFSGSAPSITIDGTKTYFFRLIGTYGADPGSNGEWKILFNSDSGNNYSYEIYERHTRNAASGNSKALIPLSFSASSPSGQISYLAYIMPDPYTGNKCLFHGSGVGYDGSNLQELNTSARYSGASAISSFQINNGSGYAGTVYLYEIGTN